MTNEVEDGIHDLWRKAIMEFYNKMLGGCDYSIFEVLHFGMNLPGIWKRLGISENTNSSKAIPNVFRESSENQ